LAAFLDQVHPMAYPETDELSQVGLIQKWLSGNARVVLVARFGVLEEPTVHGRGATAPRPLFEMDAKLKFLPAT
jgi:hypothetical protein